MTIVRVVLLVLMLPPLSAAQPAPAPPAQDPPPLRIGPVTLAGYLQADGLTVAGDDLEEADDTFRIRRMRIGVSGDLTPTIAWAVSLEAAGSPHLRDAYVTLKVAPWANIRVGQFYQPFGLERLTSTTRLEVIDRTTATERIALTRDPGVMVFSARPFFGWLSYFFDVSNGTGQNLADNNDAKDVTGRLVVAPPAWRGLSIGISGSSGEQPNGTRTRGELDVSIDRRTFRVAVEGLTETHDGPAPDRHGFYVLGAYRIRPRQANPHFRMLELAARYAVLDDASMMRTGSPTASFIPESTGDVQFGANYYVNGNVRIQANGIVPADDRDVPTATFITRLQLVF